MRYIEWEIENYPDKYRQLRCNQVLDMQTLAHVIGNVDRPDGVKWEDFKKVLNEVAETINIVPAVDAVEVVRCKDCIACDRPPFPPTIKLEHGCWCVINDHIVSLDDFCSYGETVDGKCLRKTADEKDRREAAEQDAYEQLGNLGNPEDGSL